MKELTPGQWFWLCYGAIALWMLLRGCVNEDMRRNVPWPDRAVVLALSTLLWPVEFVGYCHYLYVTYLRKD